MPNPSFSRLAGWWKCGKSWSPRNNDCRVTNRRRTRRRRSTLWPADAVERLQDWRIDLDLRLRFRHGVRQPVEDKDIAATLYQGHSSVRRNADGVPEVLGVREATQFLASRDVPQLTQLRPSLPDVLADRQKPVAVRDTPRRAPRTGGPPARSRRPTRRTTSSVTRAVGPGASIR